MNELTRAVAIPGQGTLPLVSFCLAPTQFLLTRNQIFNVPKLISLYQTELASWQDILLITTLGPQPSLTTPKSPTDHCIFMGCLVSYHQHHRTPTARCQEEGRETSYCFAQPSQQSIWGNVRLRAGTRLLFPGWSHQEDSREESLREKIGYKGWGAQCQD